jgi:hypothetical protein
MVRGRLGRFDRGGFRGENPKPRARVLALGSVEVTPKAGSASVAANGPGSVPFVVTNHSSVTRALGLRIVAYRGRAEAALVSEPQPFTGLTAGVAQVMTRAPVFPAGAGASAGRSTPPPPRYF